MVQRFASCPHATHFVFPGSMGSHLDWSKGIHKDFAPADGARSSVGSALREMRVSIIFSALTESGYSRPSAPLLDIIFTLFAFTPWDNDDILVIKGGDEIFPLRNGLESLLVCCLGAGE